MTSADPELACPEAYLDGQESELQTVEQNTADYIPTDALKV
jgi:hypothetical protein